MATGWIRAYREEDRELRNRGGFVSRNDRALFRRDFRTALRRSASDSADPVRELQ